jgi:hypothetical protein
MRASSSKNDIQCYLGVCSLRTTFLKYLSLITLAHQIPTFIFSTRNSKSVRWNTNAPTVEHRNKWESARNIKGTVLGITVLPFLGLGAIISLESGVEPDKKVYRITISHFLECTCHDFLNMAVASIGKRAPYVNCKHLYYIFRYFYKMNCKDDKFIHSPSLSFNEVKQLLVRA